MTVSPKIRGWSVAFVFTLLNVLLLALHKDDVPLRDVTVWVGALMLNYFLVNREWNGAPVLSGSLAELHRKSQGLEILMGTGLILVPWIVIVAFRGHNNVISLLAPHLFVLQAQVAGESIIGTGGESKKWLMFIYTCLGNGYRLIPLTIWFRRTVQQMLFRDNQEEDSITLPWLPGAVVAILPAYALLLWLYFGVYFAPTVWYPLFERPKKAA